MLFRVVVLGSLLATAPLFGQDANVDYREDVVYGKGGDLELHLDMASPKDLKRPAPCIVVIHGGAWRAGDKQQHTREIMSFAQQGYVAATIQYRFCPEHRFPAQIEDVKCAVRYLRAHADQYHIDPERIGAIGFSAGAHLSMMLGTMGPEDGLEGEGGWPKQSSRVQAVVSFFGPTELDAEDIPAPSIPLVNALIGGSKTEFPKQFRAASPLHYVSQGDAAMLLFQGTEDPLVPYTQAIKMVRAMTDADVPGRIEFLIDAGHGWAGSDLERTVDQTNRFLSRHLRHEPADSAE